MSRTGPRGRGPGGGDGPHSSHMASSFTDLMASLMVIFILLFVATLSNAAKKRETTSEMSGALERLGKRRNGRGGDTKRRSRSVCGGDSHAGRPALQTR